MVKKKAAFVVRITGDSKAAEREMEKMRQKAGEMGGTFEDIGGKITSALGPAALAAGVLGAAAGVAALFVKGFMDGIEAEALTDRLKAQLSLTEDEAAVSGEIASAVYREAWGENLAEVNEAIKDVVQILDQDLTGASQDVTKGLVEDALTIADVWDKDVNEVIRAAGALLDNDLADSADHAFDIIATGLTEGADLNGDFLDSLFEYSTFFGQAGLSAEQMLSGLIAGTDAGMMGVDKVGDAVKEMSIRIQDGSAASTEALEAIGLDADGIAASFAAGGESAQIASMDVLTALADVEDPLQQTQAAIALLGTPFEDLGVIGPEVLEALASGTLDLRDTADVAADAYDNTATAMEEFKRKGGGAIQDFVASALAAFGVGGKDGSLKSGLDAINDWIDDNQDQIKEWGRQFAEAIMTVWEETEGLRKLLGTITEWLTDGGNLDSIATWAGRFITWGGYVVDVMESVLAPLIAVIDAVKWVNDHLPGGGSASSGTGKASGKGGTSGGGGGGGGLAKFHDGGIFTTSGGTEGLAMLQDGEGVFTRGQMAALGGMRGDTINITIEAGTVIAEADLVNRLESELIRRSRRSGQGLAVR